MVEVVVYWVISYRSKKHSGQYSWPDVPCSPGPIVNWKILTQGLLRNYFIDWSRFKYKDVESYKNRYTTYFDDMKIKMWWWRKCGRWCGIVCWSINHERESILELSSGPRGINVITSKIRLEHAAKRYGHQWFFVPRRNQCSLTALMIVGVEVRSITSDLAIDLQKGSNGITNTSGEQRKKFILQKQDQSSYCFAGRYNSVILRYLFS
jgi:hypothetical protein